MTADEGRIAGKGPDFRPLYAQVKDLMVQRMVSGEWLPGEALPSENRLAEEFRVSQGTVRKALDELAAQRLVVRRQGRGTFIAKHSRQHSLFHFFHIVDSASGVKELPTSRVIELRTDRASREQAARLGLAPRARVHNLLRLRAIAGRPVILERITLPAAIFPSLSLPLDIEMPDELYVLYQQKFGVSVVRAKERLTATAADPLDAHHLRLAEGAPLLSIDRLALSLEGMPVEWRTSRCDTRGYHYYSDIE